MVNVVCPDCGKKVGDIEEVERGPALSFRSEQPAEDGWPDVFPNKRGLLPFSEQKAAQGHIPPLVSWGNLLLGDVPDDTCFDFECPDHRCFVLTAAEVRKAAHGKSKRLPAHRP
jgi:hypothetical protein